MLVGGCGGEARDAARNDGVAGGGASTQGSAGTGGSSGRGIGGASGGGAGIGGSAGRVGPGGTAGSGGAQDRCQLPRDTRACDAGTHSFHFDAALGECVVLTSIECQNNANQFATLAECLSACGGEPARAACDGDLDCEIVDRLCCPACDMTSQADVEAVHRSQVPAYLQDLGCDVGCAPCPPVDELDRTRQYFVPWCFQGQCLVRDLRGTGHVGCQQDSDCRLRDGAGCCEDCDGIGFVALSSTEYLEGSCDDVDCAACDSPIPSELEATCDMSGSAFQCRVVRTGGP